MTIKEMVEYTGLTQASFARVYKIPLRTLEDWLAGRRQPKGEYVYYLLERAVKEDVEHDNFLKLTMERQKEEADRADKVNL